MPKLKKPTSPKPEIKPVPTKRRLTPYEQQQKDLTVVLESMAQDIQTLYMNIEHLMIYSTIIANVNAALAKILINKKITTEKGIQKHYEIVVKEMKQKEKEIKEELEKFKSFDNIDMSAFNMKDMKVS